MRQHVADLMAQITDLQRLKRCEQGETDICHVSIPQIYEKSLKIRQLCVAKLLYFQQKNTEKMPTLASRHFCFDAICLASGAKGDKHPFGTPALTLLNEHFGRYVALTADVNARHQIVAVDAHTLQVEELNLALGVNTNTLNPRGCSRVES